MREKDSSAALGNNSPELFTDENGESLSPIGSAATGKETFNCSSPVDPTLVKKITTYLLGLCSRPGDSEQSQQSYEELRGHLTMEYNTFVREKGLSVLNESELEELLTNQSQEWSKKLRKNNRTRLQAQPGDPQGKRNLACTCSIS